MATQEYINAQIKAAGNTNFANAEVEKAMLGCFMKYPRDCESFISEIRESEFYFDKHRNVFKAIRLVLAEHMEVNLITIDERLGKIVSGGAGEYPPLLIECMGKSVGSSVAESYFKIIRELSVRRNAIRMIDEAAHLLNDPGQSINAIMDGIRTQACDLTVSEHSWVSMADVMLHTYEYLEERTKGEVVSITTGIPNIDNLIGGFFGGELTVVGARPGVGKSVFGMNVAIAAAMRGFKVGVISREMIDVQYGQRVLSYESLVDGMKIRKAKLNDDDWDKLSEGMMLASALNIDFQFKIRTVEDLRAAVQRKINRGDLDILIVDYLQLMDTAQQYKEDRLRVGHISRALKEIAKDFNIPVIALAQVKRYAGGARAKMPTLEDLKDSGSIEQDADGVIFVHDPYSADDEYVDPRDKETFEAYRAIGYTYLCIGVAKQRQGVTGVACVLLDKKTMHFSMIDRTGREG